MCIRDSPVGEHDDFVDTTTQALLRYRKGGFISLDSDEKDDKMYQYRRRAAYYWCLKTCTGGLKKP